MGANVGYRDFVREQRLPAKYFMGFGVVENVAPESAALGWQFSDVPNPTPDPFYSTSHPI